jgi:hypothetical protein
MREKSKAIGPVFVAFVVLLFLAAPAGAAPVSGPRYSAVGDYSFNPCTSPCDTFPSADYSGGLSCVEDCANSPGSASFSLSLIASDSFRGCRFRRAEGDVAISWSDATSSAARVKARSRDHKAYLLDGVVDSGQFVAYRVTGWVTYPTDPIGACGAGTFTGDLTFLPPSPI